jgi:hypothetical protein
VNRLEFLSGFLLMLGGVPLLAYGAYRFDRWIDGV